MTQGIILRRTAELLRAYLPPKTELVLFCTMSALQCRLYGLISDFVHHQLVAGDTRNFLPYISLLRQLCNAPELLRNDASESLGGTDGSDTAALVQAAVSMMNRRDAGLTTGLHQSGKLMVLHRLMTAIHRNTNDKVIIVSNYTTTLDMLQRYCAAQSFPTLRLDGRTRPDARIKLVSQFNRAEEKRRDTDPFVFLLSSKSGGVGLNLVGANRLVLFDSDWNPATDRQAMARIHRDGQSKPCYIYRLLLVGTMDEKIYQRQLTKIGLSNALMNEGRDDSTATDSGSGSDSFSQEELKDIFNYHPTSRCMTHDLLDCACGGRGQGTSPLDTTSCAMADSVTTRPQRGFISAAQLSHEEGMEREQRQQLARQLGDFLHFDTEQMSHGFALDDMVWHVRESQNTLDETDASSDLVPWPFPPTQSQGDDLSLLPATASDALAALLRRHMTPPTTYVCI